MTSYGDGTMERWSAAAEQLKQTVHLAADSVGDLLYKKCKQNNRSSIHQSITVDSE